MTDGGDDDTRSYKILSLDGGGIRGVFPAAFLAKLEEQVGTPIGSYFDLIAGTSTGGVIAIGLGLGLPASEILRLYEKQGPAIFDQGHGPVEDWVRQRVRGVRHLFSSKYSSTPFREALAGILGQRRLGESRTRLLIPAWHPMLERVYIYKTAHHPRLETDYKETRARRRHGDRGGADVSATACHARINRTRRRRRLGEQSHRRRDHRGRRIAELAGRSALRSCSIGTTNDVVAPPRWKGKLPMASSLARLFMAGQSHSALGTAKIITGDGHHRKAIWRVDQVAPAGRYTLDNAARIAEMKDRGFTEAREQIPDLRRHFFGRQAEPFVPYHELQLQ